MEAMFGNVMLLVVSFADYLMPIMFLMFTFGVATRALVYFTVKREEWFVFEFEKRMVKHLDYENVTGPRSFYVMLKKTLEKTFYECFEVRSVMRRRRMDHIMTPADRLFLIQSGCAYLVRDSLKAAQGIRKSDEKEEKREMLDISRVVLGNNPCFSKVLGVAPIGTINDFLGQLPGLFVVVGILGTFMGIMKGLPELGGMDLNDPAGTKSVMDEFLVRVSYSMGASAFGIMCSILMQIYNSFINPERVFIDVVDKYEQLLSYLWRRSDNNEIPAGLQAFDEHRDPTEALAELSLQKELTSIGQKKSFFSKKEQKNTRGIPQPSQTGVFQNLHGTATHPMPGAPVPQQGFPPQGAPHGYPQQTVQPPHPGFPQQPQQGIPQPPAQPQTTPPGVAPTDDPNKKKVA